MIYRKYGSYNVSVLGYGGMRFDTSQTIDQNIENVIYARSKGINIFDAGSSYSKARSELILKEAMTVSGSLPFYIHTKTQKFTAIEVRKDIDRMLKLYNLSSLDYLSLWRIQDRQDWRRRENAGIIKEVIKAKEEGLIKNLGVTSHMDFSDNLYLLLKEIFDIIMIPYSVLSYQLHCSDIIYANLTGVGVSIMNPLAGGIVFHNKFKDLPVRPNQSILDMALTYHLSSDHISTSFVGFRSMEDIDEAVAVVNTFKPYTPNEHKTLTEKVSGTESFCTLCQYCMEICPVKIPIWKFMHVYNLITLSSIKNVNKYLKGLYNVDISRLNECLKCGACEAACPNSINIIDRFDHLKTFN